ncbi:MAG: radical SAM protein [Thermoplasmata archaeon]
MLITPKYMRTSTAAAMKLGFMPGKFIRDAKLRCLNLLEVYEERCAGRCAYCGLSAARERDDTFIRVEWPVYKVDDIIEKVNEKGNFERVCISMITHKRGYKDCLNLVKRFSKETDLLISCLITPTVIKGKEKLRLLGEAGADKIGIAVDCATEEIFERYRGKGVRGPHRWANYWRCAKESVEIFGKGNVGVHLIVGLGETEEEMVSTIWRAEEMGIDTHLFCFYPEKGSMLEGKVRVSLGHYRRVQLARYLINEMDASYEDMKFNENGEIIYFGIEDKEVNRIIKSGKPFLTSGCKGKYGETACTRPFGNERPSEEPRNFPFEPNENEIKKIKEDIRKYS